MRGIGRGRERSEAGCRKNARNVVHCFYLCEIEGKRYEASLKQLKAYRKESIFGPLFKLLEAGFELLVPLLVAAMIDQGVKLGDKSVIVRMSLMMVGLGLIGLLCSVTAQYFAAKAAVGSTTRLRRALFAHLQTLSHTELDTIGASTMLTRLTSDMNQVQSGVNLTLRLALRSPFVVFGAMVMAFTIDVHAAAVFAIVIPILFAVVFGVMIVCIPLYRKVQARLDRVLGMTRENLTGVRVLRAFGREEEQKREFSARNDALTKEQNHVGRISVLLNPVTYVIINLAIVALIRTGALRVESGALSQGDVIALYNYMSQILVELIKLANLVLNITRAAACCNRIGAVLEIESSQHSPQTEPETTADAPAIEFRRAGLRYAGAGGDALDGISFRAEKGQTIGVIGGTGSGKTTLVNLIPRFYDATEGSVLVDGVPVEQYPLESLRRRIGVVPQKAVLSTERSAKTCSGATRTQATGRFREALRAAQAEEIVQGKEGGLDFEIEQGGRNLSGGQRQRLTIARALVRKPEILILDDSASALDFATDAALRKALRALPERPTVVIVSQRTSSIRHADQIIVLDNGHMVGLGTHEEPLRTCEVYRRSTNRSIKKGGTVT